MIFQGMDERHRKGLAQRAAERFVLGRGQILIADHQDAMVHQGVVNLFVRGWVLDVGAELRHPGRQTGV